jgi:hypothetical protein
LTYHGGLLEANVPNSESVVGRQPDRGNSIAMTWLLSVLGNNVHLAQNVMMKSRLLVIILLSSSFLVGQEFKTDTFVWEAIPRMRLATTGILLRMVPALYTL